ncbi:MAG: fibronectin type III domain-containing protein, partial [Bacteroidales bacterium]|nr:fibronectin type III domain-containing protein [Bacteroidales bacterium]
IDTTYILSNLDPAGTYTYEIRVRAKCSDTDLSDWVEGEFSFQTLCGVISTYPYVEDFETYTPTAYATVGENPLCWTSSNTVSYASPHVTNQKANSGTKAYSMSTRGGYAYAVLPEFSVPLDSLFLRFSLHQSSISGTNTSLGYLTDANDVSTFVLIAAYTNTNNSEYTDRSIFLNAYDIPDTAQRLVFRWHSSSTWLEFHCNIDDLSINLTPACLFPFVPSVDSITQTTARIGIHPSGNETAWDIAYRNEYDENYTIVRVTDTFHTITGLTPNEYHYVKTRAVCSTDNISDWSNIISLHTMCSEISELPYAEYFDSYGTGAGKIPYCMTAGGSGTISLNSGGYEGNRIYIQAGRTVAFPAFDPNIPIHTLQVSFYAYKLSNGTVTDIEIGVMSDPTDATTFVTIQRATISSTSASNYDPFDLNLTTYDAILSNTHRHLAFRASASFLSVDNFVIDYIQPCSRVPSDSISVNNMTDTSAVISWNYDDNNQYVLKYKNSNEDEYSYIDDITSPYTLTGLDGNSIYFFHIRTSCEGLMVDYIESEEKRFQTSCATIKQFPYSENFHLYPSLSSCWNTIGNTILSTAGAGAGMIFMNTTSSATSYLISPQIDSTVDLNSLKLTFDINASSGQGLTAGLMSDPTDETTFWALGEALPSTPGTLETFSFNIENAPLTHRYIAVKAAITNNTGNYSLYFDNFKLEYRSNCLPPATFELSDIGSDYAMFTWDTDEYSNWDIAFRRSGSERWEEFYENYDGYITFSSLSAGTDYEVRIRTNCNSTVAGNWSDPFAFTTLCENVNLPYSQNFNRYFIGDIPDCFTVVTEDNSATSAVARAAFYLNASPTSYAQASLPKINSPINGMKMTFRYQNAGNNQQLYVGIMSNPYDISTFELYRVLTPTATSTWEDAEIYFNGYTGDGGMITFISDATADYRSNQIYLDDIYVDTLVGCIKPVSFSAEYPTSTSFYLNWAGTETADYWELYFAAPGENINTVEPISIYTKPYQITDLSPSTTYQLKLKTYCAEGESSEISNLFTYTTLCAAITELPYIEPFDTYGVSSTILPDCWNSVTDQLVKAHTVYGDFSAPGALSLSANARGYQIAVLPEMGIALSNTQLTFVMKAGNTSSNLEVGVMTDPYDAETFELFQTITPFSTEWNTFNVPFNSYSGSGTFIAFRTGANMATSFLIDNVVVDEAVDCVPPVALSVSNLTEYSARLVWPASSGATWQVVYGTSGFNPNTDATPVSTIDNYLNVSGLDMGVPYEFYVRMVCGDETSEWSLPFNFSALCDDITLLPYTNSFDLFGTGEGSFPLCWTSHNSSGVVGNPYLSAIHSSTPASLCLTSGATYFVMASTPRISETYLMNLSISFKMRVASTSNVLSVGVSTTPTDPSTFTQLENITLNVADTWIDTTIYIFNNPETKRYLTFRVGNSNATVLIDDLVIDPLPDCFSPRSHTFITSDISYHSAVVSWEAAISDTWDVIYGVEGFNPNSTAGITHRVTSPFDTLTGLLGNTVYWYYVRSVCGDETSEWSLHGSFRTLCDQPLSLPFTENFDSYTIATTTHNQAGIMPLCWFAHGSGSYVAPHIINSGSAFYYSSAPNALSLLSAPSTSSATYAVFPEFNRSLNGYTLSFYFRQESNDGVLSVGYVTDPENMSTFTHLQTFQIETAGRIDSMLLGDYAIPNSAHLAFRWENTNTLVHSVCVDDISIHPTYVPDCPAPTDFTVENTTHTAARISWTPGNNEVNWVVKYRPEGAIAFATVNATNNSQLTLSSLLSDTTYYVEVRSDCGNGSISDSLVGTFRTEAAPVVIYYTIEANAGDNGSISPEGNVQVVENGYQTFEFTPDEGYKVKSVVVNGTQVGTEILSYNFGPVTAHGTIRVEFTETSISDYEKSNLITIYPNPTTGELKMEKLGNFEIENVAVFDVYGKNIHSFTGQLITPNSSTFTIDISHLPAGVYFFKITTDEGVMMKKIVKS